MSKVKLLHGDCLNEIKKIPDKFIDLVITDPPYQKKSNGYYVGGGAFGTNNRTYHMELDNNKLLDSVDLKILDELVRVMKKINIYIWCNKEQLYMYMDYFKKHEQKMREKNKNYTIAIDLLTWHKTNPIPTCNNKYLSDTEYVLFFREHGVKIYGEYKTKKKYYVTSTNKTDKEKYNHPTVKPLEIIENLIVNSSSVGETILDPYMGSGTTGEGAIRKDRNFIGIEILDEYYNTAKERINQATKEVAENVKS